MKKKAYTLVNKINSRFKPGDKINVKMDNGEIVQWTMKWEASVQTSGHPVIWVVEHRSCYSADRVIV